MRKIVDTSLEAYHDKERQENALKIRDKMLEIYKSSPYKDFSSWDIHKLTGIDYENCKKRNSELQKDGMIQVFGHTKANGRRVQTYKFYTGQKVLFEPKKRTKAQQVADTIFNEIYKRFGESVVIEIKDAVSL
jgi:hypothetical protein